MTLWTWVLTGLCAAGVVLAVASIIPVALLSVRLRKKIYALQKSRLLISMQSLQMQSTRFAKLAVAAQPIGERAHRALTEIAQTKETSGATKIGGALQSTGAEIQLLIEDLS